MKKTILLIMMIFSSFVFGNSFEKSFGERITDRIKFGMTKEEFSRFQKHHYQILIPNLKVTFVTHHWFQKHHYQILMTMEDMQFTIIQEWKIRWGYQEI